MKRAPQWLLKRVISTVEMSKVATAWGTVSPFLAFGAFQSMASCPLGPIEPLHVKGKKEDSTAKY